jgi:predicted DNA-binding transcriptional regulator YafY
MPMNDATTKMERLVRIQQLFLANPTRWFTTSEIAAELSVSERQMRRYLEELDNSGRLPLMKEGWRWRLMEGGRVNLLSVQLDLAQGAALYVAARLLAQQSDEPNQHVVTALTKLIAALPQHLRPTLEAVVHGLHAAQGDAPSDISQRFSAIAYGWAQRRIVRLRYAPPHKRPFAARFAPYLLEPSGVGRTIYVLGQSTPPGALRTFKLERIEEAELTDETFEIPPTFDGLALLKRAWGVMYGDDEAVTVRLRFHPQVARRVKETVWHPSQRIEDTPDGCIWMAEIGDITEITPWVRGWGGDCEVLEPRELRDQVVSEVRRMARIYSIADRSAGPIDEDLLGKLFGE